MKLLILSAPGGSGHILIGQAFCQQANDLGHNAIHINCIDFFTQTAAQSLFFDSYDTVVTRTPRIWKMIYTLTDNYFTLLLLQHTLFRIWIWWYKKEITALIQHIHTLTPDHIIITHPAITYLLLGTQTPLHVIVTDYTVNKLWTHPSICTYFIAHDQMKKKIQSLYPSAQCLETGIPVRPCFYTTQRNNTNKYIKIPTYQGPVILFLTGGHGLADPTELIHALFVDQSPKTIFVICGKNQSLEKKLRRLIVPNHISYHCIGWVDTIDTYMRIATCIVTKPGGSTISECVALQKPMLLYQPIPGQEEENAHYTIQHNLAKHTTPSTISNDINTIPQWYVPQEIKNASKLILEALSRSDTSSLLQ